MAAPESPDSRDTRLAEALRANLRRRKAQARARQAAPEGAAVPSDAMAPPPDGRTAADDATDGR